MTHYVCIHGHFYQPPRENPWLETIERQQSAAPFPNWNERILSECYRPNAASRIVDGQGRIVKIANNYEQISFNFGPTLLSWMEREAPDVYRALIEADVRSQRRFSGHGSALAQAYNHVIMPLASKRDKYTQIRWGIRDFEHRFGRRPEGMWLPETAVDSDTLDIMAELGIAFTILAPGQAQRARRIRQNADETDWVDVSGARIDPGRVYRATTPSGRHIDIFFYDGHTSQAVAFERLLSNGGLLASRLVARGSSDEPMLSHIATDGETYGHHHRFGDMALAYALHHIEAARPERLTNYGEFRALHPATWEVEIIEDTAWSCAHGVGRWSDDCGCHTGAHADWNQRWRKPLREALLWLRDELCAIFEAEAAPLLADPWAARDDYIEVINDRAGDNVDRFLREHRAKTLSEDEQRAALQVVEMQRHAMLMFTSCGWFFDDIAGTEGIQILLYAARAIELAGCVSDRQIELEFITRLSRAESNRPEVGDGRAIYQSLVLPSRVDLRRVIAHYAVSSLFDESTGAREIYCYHVEPIDLRVLQAGKAKLAVGTVRCTSAITRAASTLSFGALHLGDHNLTGGVRSFVGDDGFRAMVRDVTEAFERADMVATQRRLDQHFLELSFSLKSLFRDHQEQILRRILAQPLDDAEASYGHLYSHHAPLMRYLVSFDLPIPESFRIAAKFVLYLRLSRALRRDDPDMTEIRSHLDEARLVGVDLEDTSMDYLWHQSLERLVGRLVASPDDLDTLDSVTRLAELCVRERFDIDLWYTQNETYKLLHNLGKTKQREAYDGDPTSERWIELFERLCRAVKIASPAQCFIIDE